MSFSTRAGWNREKVEAWLQEALVPVEPKSGFVHRLRARLVDYRGRGVASPWMLLALLGAVVLFLIAAVNAAMRLIVALFGVVTAIRRQRRNRSRSPSA
ncbi:MAG: hypothetical protein WD906_08480 [Anaerolineales bacterium]